MSCFIDLLRCLFCCADEPDCRRTSSSHYSRIPFGEQTVYDDDPSPRLSHLPISTSITSFQPHYYSSDIFATSCRRQLPDSPPAFSYKPPPQSTPTPAAASHYTSSINKPPVTSFTRSSSSSKTTPSSTIKPSSSSPKESSQPTSSNSKPNPSSQKTPPAYSRDLLPPPAFSYLPPPQSTPAPPVCSSINKPPVTSFVSSSSSSKPTPSSTIKPSSSLIQATSSNSKPNPSSKKPPPQTWSPSSSKVSLVYKPILKPASSSSSSSNVTSQHQQDREKTAYVCVEEDSLPVFMIPEDIKALIKNGIVPKILKRPLSPTTYKDYFAALLYSEDFYLEKWSDFLLNDVTLKLEKSKIFKDGKKEEKTFVAFELDSVPEKRPFLLSRDWVFARPVVNSTAEPFQGNIYKVVQRKRVLVEFEDDFYSKHRSNKKYDVSFSFNRVRLKRAHHAVENASDALFQNFLFPDCDSRASIRTTPALPSTTCHNLRGDQRSAVEHILRIKGSPPYVVIGPKPLRTRKVVCASTTREVVSEAVYQLCKKSPEYRILICAPTNSSCDELMRSLAKVIPESTMFRANAAFREKDEVPEDILRLSLYKKSCFYCPPIEKLRKYRVIFSTFISSFRLHDKGIAVGHFSHIFLADASSAIEPETLVTLTNFADKTTSVIVTGNPGDDPRWVRADIARRKGLKFSYFKRLCKRSPYTSLNPIFVTQLDWN